MSNSGKKSKKWLSLLILSLAVAIVVIDGTVLNVSITNIQNDLNSSLKDLQWAITSYSLVIAALTILGGRLGDIIGRKRAFVIGAIIFGIGSLITAVSPNIGTLIFGWSVIEGIGAALMIPASSALLVTIFEEKERGKAFGIYGATAGFASAFGPILGGFLTTNFSWRWAFGINLVVVAALVGGSFLIKEFKPNKQVSLDLLGVFLSSIGLASLTYGIIESSTYGWVQAKKAYELNGNSLDLGGLSISFYTILLGLVLIAVFIWWELHQERQSEGKALISMKMFLNKSFSLGIAIMGVLFSGFTGIITFGVVLFYQKILGLNAFDSGVGLIAMSIMIFVAAPNSANLAKRIGIKMTIQLGLAIALIGAIVLYYSLKIDATRLSLSPALGLFGLGFGLIMSQLTNLILSSVTPAQAGEASGVNGTIREVGRAFGAAIIGAVFLSASASIATDRLNNTKLPAQIKDPIVQKISDGDTSSNQNSGNQSKLSSSAKQEINDAVNEGILAGSKQSIIFTGIFILISLGISFLLPETNRQAETKSEVAHS